MYAGLGIDNLPRMTNRTATRLLEEETVEIGELPSSK